MRPDAYDADLREALTVLLEAVESRLGGGGLQGCEVIMEHALAVHMVAAKATALRNLDRHHARVHVAIQAARNERDRAAESADALDVVRAALATALRELEGGS